MIQPNLKALLLSAFVLPGLGQLYKGDKVKGALLILLVNLFLLVALFLVLKGIGPALLPARAAGFSDAQRLLAQAESHSPAARWLLLSFSGLWLYGALDAAFGGRTCGKND